MRRIAFAAVLGGAVAVLTPSPARAIWGVGDTTWCLNCIPQWEAAAEWVKEGSRWAETADHYAQMGERALQTVQKLDRAYQAVTHPTDLASAVWALNELGIRNPLPVDPLTVQRLVSGAASLGTGGLGGGGIGGISTSLYSLRAVLQGVSGANAVYRPQGDGWTDRQLRESGQGLDAVQAMALELYRAAGERIPLVQQLQDRIAGANTPAEREALIARLGAEQAAMLASQAQAQNLATVAAATSELRRQRGDERLASSIDEALREAKARGIIQ